MRLLLDAYDASLRRHASYASLKTTEMIIDRLENSDKYIGLHPRFAEAFAFIKAQDLPSLSQGKIAINGPELHASVSNKDGVARDSAKFEAHDHFLDIQVCPQGSEEFGWKPRAACVSVKEPYNTD